MSGWDDLPYEMPIGTIDEDTTDRLLAGRIDPDDAPPGYAGVARILQAAGSLPRSEHLSREAELVVAAREVMGLRSPPGGGAGGSRTRHRRVVAGLIVTGALVGIPGPRRGERSTRTPPNTRSPACSTRSGSRSRGTRITRRARVRRSRTSPPRPARSASPREPRSQRRRAVGRARPVNTATRGTAAGASSDTPSVGGTGRADTASNGKSTHGTAKANVKSGGRSSAGSGNAAKVPATAIEHGGNPAAHP